MSRFRKNGFTVSLAIILLVVSPRFVKADLTEADEREVNNFRLSEQKLEQFAKATKNLVAALQKNPDMPGHIPGNKEGQENLAAMVRAFDSIPDAKKAVQESGMTTQDYVLFQLATIYGAAGHLILKSGGTLPAGYSKENVEFYRNHEAEFMKLEPDFKMLEKLTGDDSDPDEDSMEDEDDEEDEDE